MIWLARNNTRHLIGAVLLRSESLPKPVRSLVSKNGLLFWLKSNAGQAFSFESADYAAIAVADAEDTDSMSADFQLLARALLRLAEDANSAIAIQENVKDIQASEKLMSLIVLKIYGSLILYLVFVVSV